MLTLERPTNKKRRILMILSCQNISKAFSDVDILTAKNANIPCISVLWGFRDKNFLEENGAKVFASEPKEILEIIEKKIYLS